MESVPNLRHGIHFDAGVTLILKEVTDVSEVESEPFEIPVKGIVSDVGLRELLKVPVEISITEVENKPVLSTADKVSAFSQNIPTIGSALLARHLNSKLSLHVHPTANLIIDSEGNRNDGVSLADLNGAISRQKNLPGSKIYVVSTLGISVVGTISNEDIKKARELNVLPWNLMMKDNKTGIEAARIQEKAVNEFMSQTDCVTFTSWTDAERIKEIIKEINAAFLQ